MTHELSFLPINVFLMNRFRYLCKEVEKNMDIDIRTQSLPGALCIIVRV